MERKKESSHRISRTHLPLSLFQHRASLCFPRIPCSSSVPVDLFSSICCGSKPSQSSQSQPSMAMTHLGTRTHISLPLTLNISSRLCKGTKLCVCLLVLGRQHQQPGDTPVKPALNTNNHTDTSEQLDSSLA